MRPSRSLFALLFLACTDPKGDYDDYVNRTAKYRTSMEAGATDSMAPTTAVKGTYYLACLPFLAFGDITEQFRFYVDSEFTPAMSGGGGKLTLHLTPMVIRDAMGNLLPESTLKLKNEMVGVLSVMDVPVAANGKFTANFMTANVDEHSNPISFRNITVENTTVVGIFQASPDGGETQYCGGLSGQVTQPIQQDLGQPSQNPCLFIPLKEGDPLPMEMVTDFMCPGI